MSRLARVLLFACSAIAFFFVFLWGLRGLPAFGCATIGIATTAVSCSTASSIGAGPTEQLTPIASTGRAASRTPKSAGLTPSRLFPSSPSVICATIGSSDTLRTPRIAASISARS